jgi:class 3 adenylate cyclase
VRARIGLESGSAVLDASGEIYGDVANVAARVQALADPGAILVTARVVRRQIAGVFIAEERGTGSFERAVAVAVPGSGISPRLWVATRKSPC